MKKKILILTMLLMVNTLLFGCEYLIKDSDNTTTTADVGTSPSTNPIEADTLYTIDQVKGGTVGESYKTKGSIVGICSEGFLLYDETGFIYVLDNNPLHSINDYVEVSGIISKIDGEILFEEGLTINKLFTEESHTFTVNELNGSEITTFVNSYRVGDYVRFSGTLTINNDTLNLSIPNTDVVGVLNPSTNLMINQMSGKSVTVEGYVLSVTRNDTQYLNLLVTSVIENIETVVHTTFPLTILTVNDLHGYIEQDEFGRDGLSNMSYLVNNIRNSNSLDDIILIGNGDMFQGTSISNMTNGLAVLESMNAMGFDAMGIGNHEFDWELTTILDYFDHDETNGEANFPLLNANIYKVSDNSLLSNSYGNVLNSVVVEREGIEVGIISYVGDVYDSIAYDKVDEYIFDLEIANSVKNIAVPLKQSGVDVIVVNIHGGDGYDINRYNYNLQLAELKDSNGDYLVDLVINGHTHKIQEGAIRRINGGYLPVIQAGGNGSNFGKVTLTVNLDSMDVIAHNTEIINISTAGTNYDATVEKIIDDFSESLGNEVLAVAGETIDYKDQLFNWTGNVMLAATGADIAIHNDGGIRSNGGITKGSDVTLNQMYEVAPFDNTIWLVEATYAEIKSLIDNSALFYSMADSVDPNSSEKYTVALISYVYYWDDLDNVRSINDVDTGFYIRDILIEDIRIKGLNGELFSPYSNPIASIDLKYIQ